MNAVPTIRAEVVDHPQGGRTIAVPVGGSSTVRIYSGFTTLPARRRRRTRRATS